MKYIVLSGISLMALKNLEQNKVKTIEIRSPHNFLSAIEAQVGDVLFLTTTSMEDVGVGTKGYIAKILEKQVSMHRIIHQTDELFEEAEVQMARLKLEMKGHARVRRSISYAMGEAIIVDADEVQFFEGR
ncbi:MAG: DUF473 domain-containing protein [Candidatus Methanoperedens sp.]|nr:DUF473 domain-containing protein [Candidatus Methanoperedens sp.]